MLFFKKKPLISSPEKKAAEKLPKTKKVQFLPQKIEEITELLDNDLFALTKLEPVNYYASKETFLQCTFFYNEDYSEVYFVVEYYDNDRPKGETPYYKADYELFRKTVARFGQHLPKRD